MTLSMDKMAELLMQIPLAGINIIVVVMFLKYIERNDVRQKDFITQMRADHNTALIALSKETATLDADINALKVVTIEHNALMLSALDQMREQVRRRRAGDITKP